MTDDKLNPEVDTTKFVNIDDQPFDIYIGGKVARHLEPKDEHMLPVWVAQVGAKHLVDRILQEKYGIHDTLRDTPQRQTLFAQILPEMAEARDIKPLTEEDFRKKITEQIAGQEKLIRAMTGEKDKQIADMQKEIEELKKQVVAKTVIRRQVSN